MSKIEELAKEYCKKEHLKGSSFDDISMMKPAYIAGANAVLREIENIIELEETTFVYTLEQYIKTQYLKDKIKELKGE